MSKLPATIAETIKGAVGEERPPLDAMVIVGLLQALQDDKGWADFFHDLFWRALGDNLAAAG